MQALRARLSHETHVSIGYWTGICPVCGLIRHNNRNQHPNRDMARHRISCMFRKSNKETGSRPIPSHLSDLFKLLGTALLVVAALVVVTFSTHNIGQPGLKRLLSALIYLVVGAYGLYVTLKHRTHLNQLPDSLGTRKVKRLQATFFILSVLFLSGAAWNFWLFASSK